MVNEKMCIGVKQYGLMLRINPNISADIIAEKDGCRQMVHETES